MLPRLFGVAVCVGVDVCVGLAVAVRVGVDVAVRVDVEVIVGAWVVAVGVLVAVGSLSCSSGSGWLSDVWVGVGVCVGVGASGLRRRAGRSCAGSSGCPDRWPAPAGQSCC